MRWWVAAGAAFVAVMAILWLAAGRAEAVAPSAEDGGEIAARYCAGCHVISLSGDGVERGPGFPTLAYTLNRVQIIEALTGPHAQPMRGFTLSAREAEDIAAYIASLRSDQAQR